MIKVVAGRLSEADVREFLGNPFSDMIKFVVDVEKEIAAFGGELHSDAEELLLGKGSKQQNLWGGNFYPDRPAPERVEFSSMINIRPSAGNLSMEVKDEKVRSQIRKILGKILP